MFCEMRFATRAKKAKLLVKADEEKELITLKIIDSGDGVPEAELSRIFEPLYRVEKDRARQTGGSGLRFGNRQNLHRSLRRKSYG